MTRLSYQQLTQLAEEQITRYRDEWAAHAAAGRRVDWLHDQAFGAYLLWYRASPDNPRREADKERLYALVRSIGEPVGQLEQGAA